MQKHDVRLEWKRSSLRVFLWAAVFLFLSGLAILLLPPGNGAQLAVLAHTALGLVFLVPVFFYLIPHLARRWNAPLSHRALLGWTSGALLLAAGVSGIVLTIQAGFGRRIGATWDFVHIVSGCAIAAVLGAHLWTAVRRVEQAETRYVRRLLTSSVAIGVVLSALPLLGGSAVPTGVERKPFPEGYGYRYGKDPFAPSRARTDWLWRADRDHDWLASVQGLANAPDAKLARTIADYKKSHAADTLALRAGEDHPNELNGYAEDARRIAALEKAAGEKDPNQRRAALDALAGEIAKAIAQDEEKVKTMGAIPSSAMAGSRTCGTTGCHEEILKEWQPSAHRYASRSKFFQLIQGAMAESNGAESTRYCAGCHDPISLFSGAKNIFHSDLSSPGADEGISCVSCHRIVRTDVKGNANYVFSPPPHYLAEDSFLGRFLIRAYPKMHDAEYERPLLQTPEFCGACHKQFIDKEINRATRVQLQNQYDSWKGSHWFVPDAKNPQRADPKKALACRDCHMRLTAGNDPSILAGPGEHRHHGFIAANQWLPLLHHLPNAKEHVRLTEQWLQGKTVIPEIADRWPSGPVIPLEIEAPKTVVPGQKIEIHVLARNAKAGHSFPTGPLDVIQSWVEVIATQNGKEIFHSGTLDKDGFLRPGAWIFKAEGVDRAGNLIDRHNLWEMVGARFRRVLFPGFSDSQEYAFDCEKKEPIQGTNVSFQASAPGDIHVEAILHYRKVDQTLLNMLQPDGKARAPVTDMSHASATIRIAEPGK